MHTITLNVHNKLYQPLISLLTNWDTENIKIIEDNTVNSKISTKNSIKKILSENNIELFGKIENPIEWQQKQREEWI